MALKFWTCLETDKYNIGLTGKTIYIYDKKGNEIIKFSDLSYAYRACVSPDQDLLVVKSTEGWIAIYSLDQLEIVRKIHFSKVNYAQDDNIIFSPDGKFILNIERQIIETKTALSIYNTNDFILNKRLFEDNEDLVLSIIEYDKESCNYFILGLIRDSQTRAANAFFVAKLIDDKLSDMKYIDEATYDFYVSSKNVEACGFTEKAYNWLILFKTVSLKELKTMDLSLLNLWERN